VIDVPAEPGRGGEAHLLLGDSAYLAQLDWSPDGTMVAFVSGRDGNHEIYTMDVADALANTGNNLQRLTHDGVTDEDPAWSPDGTRIAFSSTRDGNMNIYVMDADGSNQQQLTSDGADESWPTWSPDGTQVAFMSARDSMGFEIWVMSADGSDQRQLTGSLGDYPDWRPAE
jgi:Tol biopolymer transport system component